MNAKTIITMILFLIIPPLAGHAGTEEVVAAQEKLDFNNAEALKKILAEAILRDALKERGAEGAKLFYAPDTQIPYTGWAKKLYDNGKLKSLGYCRDGKPTPFSPASGPATRSFNGLHPKSKFLAAPLKATASERHGRNGVPNTSFIRVLSGIKLSMPWMS
jgi:hypothetical protein